MSASHALGSCLYCGAPAVHAHHPTGRAGPKQSYFDAGFTVALCRSCHVAEHVALRAEGLGW